MDDERFERRMSEIEEAIRTLEKGLPEMTREIARSEIFKLMNADDSHDTATTKEYD